MNIDDAAGTIYAEQIDVSQWTSAPLRLTSTAMINAVPDVVFRTLSDPETICQLFSWMESVTVAPAVTSGRQGVGTLRTCILGNGLVLEEKIVHWQPPHGYACRGIDATHPFGMCGHVSVLSLSPDTCGSQLVWQHYFDHSNVPAMSAQLEQSMASVVACLLKQYGGCALRLGQSRKINIRRDMRLGGRWFRL